MVTTLLNSAYQPVAVALLSLRSPQAETYLPNTPLVNDLFTESSIETPSINTNPKVVRLHRCANPLEVSRSGLRWWMTKQVQSHPHTSVTGQQGRVDHWARWLFSKKNAARSGIGNAEFDLCIQVRTSGKFPPLPSTGAPWMKVNVVLHSHSLLNHLNNARLSIGWLQYLSDTPGRLDSCITQIVPEAACL